MKVKVESSYLWMHVNFHSMEPLVSTGSVDLQNLYLASPISLKSVPCETSAPRHVFPSISQVDMKNGQDYRKDTYAHTYICCVYVYCTHI